MKEDQNTNELRQIRRALLQAAKEDYLEALKDAPEAPPFSKNHRRWERRFLKDPFSLITPHRPLWQRGLRTAACFVFVTSVVFGSVMVGSPTARAAVIGWFTQSSTTHDSYVFYGTEKAGEMLSWRLTDLPEGYHQTEYIDLGIMVNILYNNDDPNMEIEFSYQRMSEGMGESLDNEHHTVTSVTINRMSGKFYDATNDSPNMLIWFDEQNDYTFLLTSRQPKNTLLKLAESVQVA